MNHSDRDGLALPKSAPQYVPNGGGNFWGKQIIFKYLVMNKILITLIFLALSICLFGQEKSIKYYQNVKLKKETIESKANYKVITTTIGKDIIEELFEIKTNRLIWHKSFRNSKPYGEWYSFDENNLKITNVVYGRFKPDDFMAYDLGSQKLIENIEGEFIKPKLIGIDEVISSKAEKNHVSDLSVWIGFNINYPVEAQIEGIQGKVQAQFTIDDTGEINHVRITDGVDEILDAESYRLLNSIPKMQPAKLNGKAIKLYIEAPISFLLK
jgi:hypothetical protein